MSEKVPFDLGGEFQDRNYKSCFARSVAVNSQYKQTKSLDFRHQPPKEEDNIGGDVSKKSLLLNRSAFPLESQDVVRLRKNARNCNKDDIRRLSFGSVSNSRRSSMCSSRIAEIPVENMFNQSKIETLQWQLKEIEKSREMYRAVMKQVVTFLEKAHHSLEILGHRLNRKDSMSRSKSEYLTKSENSETLIQGLNGVNDLSWQKQKKPEVSPEEVPPEKLSQEAFRLLRTAQSLLSTREPNLAHRDPQNDLEFLAQLAKEFPQTPESRPQRATSFSLSPKLILPENEVKISTAFNRKLSLQFSESRRNSVGKIKSIQTDSARGSVAESENDFLTSTVGEFSSGKGKEKSVSPAAGSISSVEDESGFSSMNSFQDVGLPLVNSTIADEVSAKNALLRSMLHNNSDYPSLNYSEHNSILDNTLVSSSNQTESQEKNPNANDVKLWQKTPVTSHHKRWHSSPAEEQSTQSMKVLWV